MQFSKFNMNSISSLLLVQSIFTLDYPFYDWNSLLSVVKASSKCPHSCMCDSRWQYYHNHSRTKVQLQSAPLLCVLFSNEEE